MGPGKEASNAWMQRALDELWAYAQGLFVPLEDEPALLEAGIFPNLEEVKGAWLEHRLDRGGGEGEAARVQRRAARTRR